jgi:hypothetical protein
MVKVGNEGCMKGDAGCKAKGGRTIKTVCVHEGKRPLKVTVTPLSKCISAASPALSGCLWWW